MLQAPIAHAGGIASILAAMAAHPVHIDVQTQACEVMISLTRGNAKNQVCSISLNILYTWC